MSEEDFREGLPPTKEQIEAHYEPGKPYGYWRRKGDPRAFRLGWHNDEVVYDCTPWRSSERLMSVPTSLYCSAWQPVDSSNRLLPWSVVEVSEYRTPTDDEIRAHEANGGTWSYKENESNCFVLFRFRDDKLLGWYVSVPALWVGGLPPDAWPLSDTRYHRLRQAKFRPVDLKGKPVPWSSLRAARLQEIHTQKSQSKETMVVTLDQQDQFFAGVTMQIDISKLSTEDRTQLRRQLDAAEPPTFNSALRSGLEHAPIELALDRAHALLDRAVDTLWAAGSEDDKATVRRFFRDALKSEYGKAGMAFGAGALLPHAADAAGALLPSESNAPRYLNRAAWLFTERGATIVAREIGSTAIDSIGPLVGTLRVLLADLVNGLRTAEAGIAGLLPAASRPLNFDAVPKPDTVEK